MKRVLLIAALALSAAAPALAADLPPPMAPPPRAPAAYVPVVPMFTWTGIYIGANAGYGFGSSSWTTAAGSVGSFSLNGPLAGGTLGGNYQIGQFVVGGEGDFDWQNLRGATASGICAPGAVGGCALASTWLATVRVRAGYAMDRVLLYVTGGGAFTDVKPSTGSLSYGGGTEAGWTAGGGVEYAITDNWTAKAEYLYASFQKATCNATSCGGPLGVPPIVFSPTSVSFNENIVRAGVNYKF
jgi:outer membrane immunogenic protein